MDDLVHASPRRDFHRVIVELRQRLFALSFVAKLVIVPILGLFLANCSDASMGPSEANTQTAVKIKPVSLARVELGKKHFVEFLEVMPGEVAMFEEGNIDDGDLPVDRSDWGQLLPSQVFKKLDPNKEVPGALQAADARVKEYKSKVAKIPNDKKKYDPSGSGFYGGQSESGPPDKDREDVSTPAPGIEAKANGRSAVAFDWDDYWWQTNYCSSYRVHSTWCPTYVAGAQTGWTYGMYFEMSAASMSYSQSAHYWVDWWNGSASVRLFDHTLGPRSWSTWSWPTEHWFWGGVEGFQPNPLVFFAKRTRTAIPWFNTYNFNPYNADRDFENDIQGVTHDASNWYFARTDYEWNDPEGELITPWYVGSNLQYGNPGRVTINSWYQSGWNHFGDITLHGSNIYIPVEQEGNPGAGCAIGVVTTSMVPIVLGWVPIYSGCPWIAYNPADFLFYMPDGPDVLRKFHIEISGSQIAIVEPEPPVYLWGIQGGLQGAEFSPRGNLYMFNGYRESPLRIYGVDPYNGQVYERGGWDVTPAERWEAEGVTVWDLTAGQAPNVYGQLHLQLLINYEWYEFNNDQVQFAHLYADDPSRL